MFCLSAKHSCDRQKLKIRSSSDFLLRSRVISLSPLINFRDPDSVVFSTEKTYLRPAQVRKNLQQWRFFSLVPSRGIFPYRNSTPIGPPKAELNRASIPPRKRRRVCSRSKFHFVHFCPREESNLYQRLRRALFYPLNYEGNVAAVIISASN